MAESSSTLTIDVRPSLSALDLLDDRVKALERSYGQAGAASKRAFSAEGSGAIREAQAVDRLQKEYAELKKAAETLRTALKSAYDPRAIKTYSEALAGAEVGLEKLENTAGAAGISLKKIGKEGSLAAEVVGEAFGAISKATIILAVLDQVYKIARAGLEIATNYNKARVQFTAFLGSAAEAERVLGILSDTAAKNFLNVDDVNEAGKSLLAFGESADNLAPALTRIANLAAGTGKDFNELALIYGKARTSGVLFAEDINQLTDAGIPIIQEFAKQLGVSTSEVKKLASEGKISFEELQLAFFNLTREGAKFGEQAAAQATELPGLYQSLVNRIKPYLQQLGGFFNQLGKDLINLANDTLDALGVANKAADDGGRATERSIARLQAIKQAAGDALNVDNNVTTRAAFERASQDLLDAQRDYYEQKKEQDEDAQILEDQAAAKRLGTVKKSGKDLKAERDKALREQEEYNKRLLELALQRLDPEGETFALTKEKLRFAAQKAEFQKFGLGVEEIELQHQLNLFEIRQDFDEKRKAQAAKTEQEIAQATANYQSDQLDSFQAQRDAQDAAITLGEQQAKNYLDRLRAQGADEKEIAAASLEFDLQAQKARLLNDLQFQEQRLQNIGTSDEAVIKAIKDNIELLKAQIAGIDFNLENPLDAEGKKKEPVTLASLFGIEAGSEDEKAFNAAVSQVKAGIDAITEARIQAANAAREQADQEVEEADRRVQAAQAALDSEIALAQLGYANNADNAAKNLDLANKQAEAAKRQQAAAIEQQRKANRQKALLDSAAQASSLALAAANIFAANAGVAPIVGVALAIGLVATVLAAFARIKATARGLSAKQGIQARISKDGFVAGPSHDNGGVPMEVEGGEHVTVSGKRIAVTKKPMTKKHWNLLESVNKDDRPAILKYALSLSGLNLSDLDYGPRPDIAGVTKRMQGRPVDEKAKAEKQERKERERREMEENNRLLRIMEKRLKAMEAREQWSQDGKTVKRGTHTRTFVQ